MEKVEIIRAELTELTDKALEMLLKNCNVDDIDFNTPASRLNMLLEDALWEISCLDKEDLK
jgi:hypothetical protein